MPSPDILDFEALLQPISDEQPTGIDLRSDPSPVSIYYQIKDARAAARAEERARVNVESEEPQGPPAEWRTILKLAPDAISQNAKDLEVLAWWIEALVRVHGFAGLRDGYRLARELVERFWDGLHPMPDEDGVSTRVAPFAGLNGDEAEGTLIAPIALIPITEDVGFGTFSTWQYQRARDTGGDGLDQFNASLGGTPPDFYVNLVDDIRATQEHFAAVTALLDERCGHDSPPSSTIRSALEDSLTTIQHVAKDVLPVAEAEDEGEGEEEAAAEGAAQGGGGGRGGPLRTRSDALKQLKEVSDFFRKTEPHSPVSFLVEKAVRWGQTSLPGLVAELIPDETARQHFNLITGIDAPGDAAEES